jgi:hypothetical protein
VSYQERSIRIAFQARKNIKKLLQIKQQKEDYNVATVGKLARFACNKKQIIVYRA